MPCWAAASTSSVIRPRPSRRLNSEWTWRCVKSFGAMVIGRSMVARRPGRDSWTSSRRYASISRSAPGKRATSTRRRGLADAKGSYCAMKMPMSSLTGSTMKCVFQTAGPLVRARGPGYRSDVGLDDDADAEPVPLAFDDMVVDLDRVQRRGHVIAGHQIDRFRLEQANPIQLAAPQQHPGETQVVERRSRRSRHRPTAAGSAR